MWVLALLLFVAVGFGVCPVNQGVALEMASETLKEKGKIYRRADVLIFLPIEKKLVEKRISLLDTKVKIHRLEEDVYEIKVRIRNRGDRTISDGILIQPLEGAKLESEAIYGKRVLSRTPLIFEPLTLYVTDLSYKEAKISLPPVGLGEEVELTYRVKGNHPKKPVLQGSYTTVTEEGERVYMLVAKYSILFGYGKTRSEDINLSNIRELLEGFRRAGLKPIVKVVGLADGVTKNFSKNEEVARERTRFVARKILGQNYACYIRRGFAENIR